MGVLLNPTKTGLRGHKNAALDNEVRIATNKSLKNNAERGDLPQVTSPNFEMLVHEFQEPVTHTTILVPFHTVIYYRKYRIIDKR